MTSSVKCTWLHIRAGKFNIAISFSLLQSHLTSMTNPWELQGMGPHQERPRTTRLGSTPVKDKSAETLTALDRSATQNYLLTTHLKADCAPRPVLQDRSPSHPDLCEDFGWRGRRKWPKRAVSRITSSWGRTACRTEAGHQVDSALQPERQFCSNDSTWNIPVLAVLALLPSWMPRQWLLPSWWSILCSVVCTVISFSVPLGRCQQYFC